MSRKLHIDSLSQETSEIIMKELQIKIEGSKFVHNSKPTYIYPIDVTDDYAYIPFAYGKYCSSGPFDRPEKNTFPNIDCKFNGKLRPKQKVIKKEAISHLNHYGSTIIAAYPGFGKCNRINTPIMMFDGSVKMVQDILPGEQLMGDDSTPRNVLSTCKGREQMYDVIPTKGDTYGVNESHILSLKISSHKSIFWVTSDNKYTVKRFDKKLLRFVRKNFDTEEEAIQYRDSITDDDILDIEVRDYLKIPKSIRDKLKGYKVPVTFPEKKIDLDPYFLGLWLGDGSKNTSTMTTDDKEIVDYLHEFCIKHQFNLKQGKRSKTTRHDMHYYIRDPTQHRNRLLGLFKSINVFNNKHIPFDYKCNSRSVQLSVLAGLIDSDGNYNKGCYEIVQKREELAKDIVYVCRSLGFASFIKKVNKTCTNAKNGHKAGVYYLVNIYGSNLDDIPVLLQRKKAVHRKQKKDALVTGIKVVPTKEDDYYGFTLDGNHRYVLGDFTVTHNTCTAIYMATKIKMKVMIITHRIVLIKQWQEALKKFCPNATVQVLTAKSKKKDCDFYIMNAINVPKHERSYYEDIAFLIIDEVHLIMSEILSKCMLYFTPRYVLGLSATPYREDGMNILLDLYFGKRKIYRKLFRKHKVYKIQTSFVPTIELAKNGRVNWGVLLDSQANDENRNEMIINLVKKFDKRVFLILCKRVQQGKHLVKRLMEEGEDVTSLIGKQQEYEQKSRILVGTSSKAGTGFDHPRLDAMILASDIQAYFIQYLGRCMRTEEVIPIVFDIVDKNPILDRHFRVRRNTYLEHGGNIKDFQKEYPEFEVC
jgi:superfamily II DNA or RNA helicase